MNSNLFIFSNLLIVQYRNLYSNKFELNDMVYNIYTNEKKSKIGISKQC